MVAQPRYPSTGNSRSSGHRRREQWKRLCSASNLARGVRSVAGICKADASLLGDRLMEVRQLGKSGIAGSRIGLGCTTFGREIDEEQAFRIMDHAVERGIRLFDTAEAYGGGQA